LGERRICNSLVTKHEHACCQARREKPSLSCHVWCACVQGSPIQSNIYDKLYRLCLACRPSCLTLVLPIPLSHTHTPYGPSHPPHHCFPSIQSINPKSVWWTRTPRFSSLRRRSGRTSSLGGIGSEPWSGACTGGSSTGRRRRRRRPRSPRRTRTGLRSAPSTGTTSLSLRYGVLRCGDVRFCGRLRYGTACMAWYWHRTCWHGNFPRR